MISLCLYECSLVLSLFNWHNTNTHTTCWIVSLLFCSHSHLCPFCPHLSLFVCHSVDLSLHTNLVNVSFSLSRLVADIGLCQTHHTCSLPLSLNRHNDRMLPSVFSAESVPSLSSLLCYSVFYYDSLSVSTLSWTSRNVDQFMGSLATCHTIIHREQRKCIHNFCINGSWIRGVEILNNDETHFIIWCIRTRKEIAVS